MKSLICLKTLMLFCWYLKAQVIDLTEELVEQLTAEVQESLSGTEISDQYSLEALKINNINKTTRNELARITWLTHQQIQNLIDYINHNGPLVSIYELQAVPGWDLSTIRMTAPLFRLPERGSYYDPRNTRERIQQDGGVEFLLRMKRRFPLSSGFQKSSKSIFTGSGIYWLSKFRYQHKGRIDFGVTAEKDPGEAFRWKPAHQFYGADHLSVFLKLENKGPVKKLLVGDFRVQWDQGLVLGSGLTFNKQVITGPRKVHLGIIPHTGTREYDFYRGVGLELQTGSWSLSSIASYRKLDAQILEPDSLGGLPRRISSILKTGLHRTGQELDRRMQLPEWLFGLHFRKSWLQNLTTSIAGVYRILEFPHIPTRTVHNTFAFTGKRNVNVSGSIEYQYNQISFFSQFAIGENRGWAALAGLIASLSHNFSMTLHVRNYHKKYHGIASAAFGTVRGNINEQGIYWGLQFTPSHKWTIGSSTNFYKFPYPTFTSDESNQGHEQLIRIQFTPNKIGYLDLYWRHRKKMGNEQPIYRKLTNNTTPETKHSLGFRARWANTGVFSVQSRIQYSLFRKSNVSSNGMIASNQVSYNHKFLRFTVSMAHFNTDNFENRQYVYEKDLPYSLSIPFFHGIGTRWFCLIQLKLVRNTDFWFKIAQSNLRERAQLGSGVNATLGPKRTDLSFQIRYKL